MMKPIFSTRHAITVFIVAALGALLAYVALVPTGGDVTSAAASLHVVTTTTIVQDLVQQVAGERAAVHSLLRPGMDPHAYQPVPADLVALSRADLIVLHGAGLDAWAQSMIERTRVKAKIVAVADGMKSDSDDAPEQVNRTGGEPGHEPGEHDHRHEGENPHYWFDPNLVKHYIAEIEKALISVDPAGAGVYRRNAARYVAELSALDAWIRERVAEIPESRRKLVTNHDTLSHFARRYGFEVVGTVIPGFSSEAEPSARQIAQLVRAIQSAGVSAIFTENTMSPRLAETVAREAGSSVRVVPLYTESLSTPGGPADTYLNFMRFNVNAIVQALR